MKVVKAIIAGALSLLVMVLLFGYWREKSKPVDSINSISLIEKMEKDGVPGFSAKTIYGEQISLEQFKGKIVILNLWATWCGPCVEEVPSLINLIEAMKGEVELVAVSADYALEDIQSFLKSFPKIKNPNIHIVWDENKEIMKLYSSDRLPESYVINAESKLVKKIVGTINWHTPESEEYLRSLIKK